MFGMQKKNSQPMKLVMANGEEQIVYKIDSNDVAWYNARLEKQIVKGAILGACVLATGMIVSAALNKRFPDVV